MNKSLSLAILAGGLMLIVFGVSEMNSFTSNVSRVFTGAPTDRALWLLVGGVICAVLGAAGLALGGRRN